MPIKYTDQEIHEQAVRLHLIGDSDELPRNLRSRVLATLVEVDRQQKVSGAEPELAQEIVIQPGGLILVDGNPFPWLVAAQPMDIGLNPDGVSTVRLTLMAANVQVIRPEPRPESEQ
ncbi:hypothetical protein ADK55_29115 [Streptomyces sp. WM4235]|uniref:hypothetical protein n=1 Tax=Streptomyces sp. WM4235 TaxID=1415551 RepID=UPI0006AE4D20|nr:hypothetical protein [Streptomyces sp. WM4235]KOU41254.1 hypothetical protein ADK55_29115 [Streptomyces sp. WM4235]